MLWIWPLVLSCGSKKKFYLNVLSYPRFFDKLKMKGGLFKVDTSSDVSTNFWFFIYQNDLAYCKIVKCILLWMPLENNFAKWPSFLNSPTYQRFFPTSLKWKVGSLKPILLLLFNMLSRTLFWKQNSLQDSITLKRIFL